MPKLGEFSRSVLTVLTGTVAAQGITILASPVLTRLYSPEDFGVYALLVSIVAILGSIACGRYEFGITLPAKDRDGLALLALCTALSLGTSIAIIPAILWAGDYITAQLGQPRLGPWLWWLPPILFITGFSTAGRYWLLRKKAYATLSTNNILRTVLGTGFNLFCGWAAWGQYGLIGGVLFSLCAGTLFYALRIWRESGSELQTLTLRDLRNQAWEHRGFPMYSTGSALIEAGASQIPVIFLTTLYGATTLGIFALAQRIANLPLTMVATSIGDVFRQRASEEFARDGNCLRLFDQTLLRLSLLSSGPFILAAWISPWAFGIIFGSEWAESGHFVRLLVPALALRFVSNPLGSMFFIARRQATDLLIQTLLIATMLLAFWWAGDPRSQWKPRDAILAYSVIYSTKYAVELILARQFAKGD